MAGGSGDTSAEPELPSPACSSSGAQRRGLLKYFPVIRKAIAFPGNGAGPPPRGQTADELPRAPEEAPAKAGQWNTTKEWDSQQDAPADWHYAN